MSTRLNPRNEESNEPSETKPEESTSDLTALSHPDMMWITELLSRREGITAKRILDFNKALLTGHIPAIRTDQ